MATRKNTLYAFAALAIAVVGALVFGALTLSRPRPSRHANTNANPIVEVVQAQLSAVPMVVHAMGGVQAARSIKVQPEVSGRVIVVNPRLLPGGMIKKDEILIQIDPSDYDLTIRVAQAAVTQAQLALEVQQGQRVAAVHELRLAGTDLAPTQQGMRLASRESQVENAAAQLDAAKSHLEQAQLARRRTLVRAPFDAWVLEKNVALGQVLSPQSVIATLLSSNEAWVEAALPTEQLRWIDIPGQGVEQGAHVLVRQKLAGDAEITRSGRVLALLPSLQDKGKLARLLIGIDNPFSVSRDDDVASAAGDALLRLPLLMGAFVHLEIQGHTLPNLLALPRKALREGNRVWVRDSNGCLAIRSVEIVRRDDTLVYVRGDVKEHEQVIVGRLVSPLPGMRVDVVDAVQTPEPAPSSQPGREQAARDNAQGTAHP